MNRSIDDAIETLSCESNEEVFYCVGTSLHWIIDCFDRIENILQLSEEEKEMLLALHCVNNALKHNMNFIGMQEQGHGFDYPYDYPMELKPFYIWKSMDDIKMRYEDQKEAYNKLLRGKNIESSLKDIRLKLNDIFEKVK